MRIRDRLASAAASFVEGAALMDPYAAAAVYGTDDRHPPGHPALAQSFGPGPLRPASAAGSSLLVMVPLRYRPAP
ncbi:hypothetical protein GXW82_12170 [Streptacidiphilus sp. 4-A2]|nr:hypothetical protein [Streptacidiphilus sp. 4-A2]